MRLWWRHLKFNAKVSLECAQDISAETRREEIAMQSSDAAPFSDAHTADDMFQRSDIGERAVALEIINGDVARFGTNEQEGIPTRTPSRRRTRSSRARARALLPTRARARPRLSSTTRRRQRHARRSSRLGSR